jgi:hypothetical protein
MNETKTCGTCKFRGKPVEYKGWSEDEKPTSYFLCDRIKHDTEWAYLAGQGALVEDGSGYHAALCVEDDFGCNKWEAK